MAEEIADLLSVCDVCVISGGKFEQFKTQLIDRLEVTPEALLKLHIMPTSGTSYFRFDPIRIEWVMQYSEDLSFSQRTEIAEVLQAGARELGFWESSPDGDVIEDRGSQVTFSALGQNASPESKQVWDPSGVKKQALRDYAAKRLPDLEVHVGGTTSVDVTAAGVDKSYGMHKLMDALELEREDILFFGDKLDEGGNDYPVKAMGIDTIAVRNWEETSVAIQAIVAVSRISQLVER
jgi:hypothetical protein